MGKKMHGKFPRNLHEKRVDEIQSYGWLKFVDIREITTKITEKMNHTD
jgi:hypothetical protein